MLDVALSIRKCVNRAGYEIWRKGVKVKRYQFLKRSRAVVLLLSCSFLHIWVLYLSFVVYRIRISAHSQSLLSALASFFLHPQISNTKYWRKCKSTKSSSVCRAYCLCSVYCVERSAGSVHVHYCTLYIFQYYGMNEVSFRIGDRQTPGLDSHFPSFDPTENNRESPKLPRVVDEEGSVTTSLRLLHLIQHTTYDTLYIFYIYCTCVYSIINQTHSFWILTEF